MFTSAPKRFFSVLALSFTLFSTNYSFASVYQTIQDCAELLPPGHKYKLKIEGDIDLTGEALDIQGNIAFSIEPPGKETDIDEAKKPFLNCVINLIKYNAIQYY